MLALACWRAGVLACWRVGVLACWRVGVLAYLLRRYHAPTFLALHGTPPPTVSKARVEHISPESFVVSVDGANYKLKAQSAAEAKEWVEAVQVNF